LTVAHTTILRWVQRFVPEFEKRWNRYATAAGSAWRVDETYVKGLVNLTPYWRSESW